jgi:low temperature requirement protein LtrA
MLVARAGFLIMAVATPDAYRSSGAWPFAIAYLVVVLVHAAQFGRSALGGSARAILRVLPLNLLMVAGLVLAAFLAPHRLAWIGYATAVAVIVVAAVRVRGTGFALRAEHFAERHQLLILIALGETVVATGSGAQSRLREAPVLTALLMAMVLLAALWWTYFGGDDARAAAALVTTPDSRRSELAFWGYSLGHLVHVAGLVLVAAGLHDLVVNPTDHLEGQVAATLALGTAVFLCAEAFVRRLFGLGSAVPLLAAATACCVIAVIGSHLVALVEIELLAGIVGAALVGQPVTAAEAS